MENCASLSGSTGEHAIFAMRFSPLPLRSARRVVEACAMMFPPMGFNALAPANMALPSGFATTWLVTTTATPYSSASRVRCLRNFPRCIWRALSSPRPSYSVRYRFVTESTMMTPKRASAIIPAAASRSSDWCSVLCALAYATLSSTAPGSMPNRSAIAISRCGRNVPSVSMYMALPSAPPCASGSWHVTASVWHSCVFPVRNSP